VAKKIERDSQANETNFIGAINKRKCIHRKGTKGSIIFVITITFILFYLPWLTQIIAL
jgi:hypothetical protein